MSPTCSTCADKDAYYSVRSGANFERNTEVYCEECAVPFVDRIDSDFFVISLHHEAWIDATRTAFPAFSEIELIQWFFIAQCMWTAEQAIPLTLQNGPVRAQDLLRSAVETAHCVFGPQAPDFLRRLSFTSSLMFGEILYRFIALGLFTADTDDKLEDFVPGPIDLYVRGTA